MPKNRNADKLNRLTMALREESAWMIHAPAAESLHESLLSYWGARELPEQAFGDLSPRAVQAAAAKQSTPYEVVGSIAVVSIAGMIRSKEDIWTLLGYGTANASVADAVSQALARSDVAGVLLVVDSPGGSAMGNEEAARKMRSAAESSGKPLWAVAHGIMASAAYYIGAAASRIVATPGTVVGSIGCMCIHASWRPEGIPVAFTVTRFGEMKVVPNQYEPIGDIGKAEQQRVVDQLGMQFLATVAEFRGKSIDEAKKQFADGRVFYERSEMQRIGLIDGSVDSVAAALQEMQSRFAARPSQSLQAVLEASCQPSHESGQPAAVSATHQEKDSMNPKIKAALYARGLIASLDASNDVAECALGAFFAGRGGDRPNDEAGVLAVLNGSASAKVIEAIATPLKPTVDEQAEARAEARRNEVARAKSIRERGKLLGCSAEDIEAEVASDKTAEAAVSALVDKMTAARTPVETLGASGEAQFGKDAADTLLLRAGVAVPNASEQAKKWARAGITTYALAQKSLEVQGVRFDRYGPEEEVAKLALQSAPIRSQVLMDDGGGNLNRPSSFPNLLSNFSNSLFSVGMERASPSYPLWTGRSMNDLPDLREVPFVSRSTPYVMDEVIDDERLKQLQLAEECLSLIQVRRFANKFGWTPVMVANDSLGAFAEGLIGFGGAWQNTVNLLCLGLLTGNAALLDTYSLFDNTNHGNDVTSGAAPTVAQWTAMQNKVVAQRPVGGKGYVRGALAVALIPPQINQDALQVFASFGSVPEVKNPVTDATVNIYRGTAKVVVEPELQANSTTKWYGLLDPAMMPAVVRVHQRGWGDGTQRRAWTDAETGTAWVAFEGRVGAAVKDYRPIVRNAGA